MHKFGIIGGSGLDDPKLLENYQELEVETSFGKPSSKLTTGQIGQHEVVIIARHGKGHTIMPTKVPYRANIMALKDQGCTHILATTACGSLREQIKPGDFVFVDQFIDFTKHRNLTFHEDTVVHTPMAEPFNLELRQKLIKIAHNLGYSFYEKGTMVTIEGPRFSTKAESHMFRALGADVINMSTVPEVILANELGIPYESIAMSTDYDCWKEGEEPVTLEMVFATMRENADRVKKLIIEFIKNS
ncbi:S-methyl-5'-thioadenosine phosphorylase [Candidatus Falkowbacteria bacterium]|jgi:5'-methylthioadenosine phosphorylase|nr:S-methyl-5'-thioadenosine phosphorylase [Candidatus Falkowbacteria bacterium]MBT6573472.1 S-methyl-5'-thioadenosine phosphorylase [Candidatus Falkowbacteria bacterium]MBT7501143.1 S-methyl-5'-thioadenosine phosphorylase [Candidatus Falkowbacteria bacterium]